MDENEFLLFINKCIKNLDSFIEICNQDEKIKKLIDYETTNSYISLVKDLINDIEEDIKNNILPISFFEKLTHDINHTLPINYSIPESPFESRVLACRTVAEQISGIDDLIELYYFYKALGFAKKNTLLVGANGSGKSSLANLVQRTLNSTDGIVIPAQKLLIFPTFSNTPTYTAANHNFDKYQKEIYDDKTTFNAKEMDDFEYGLTKKYGSEMVKILGLLLGERQLRINQASTKYKNTGEITKNDFRGILDDVIDIWNNLIEHRVLYCNDSNELKIKYSEHEYDAHKMSDGERIIIYLAGRVLLAPLNGLIIVDEPELHLHKSIANKLWDILEMKRTDCRFIYFTHDLDFATSRNCQKCWIRDFKFPNSWSIKIIEENEIPEDLLLKLLGSRKPILFCEGTPNSIDKTVYEILFPDFTIQSVASCSNVINYTRAFNKIGNAHAKAYGIIDRDFRDEKQLDILSKESIYSFNVAEIENLFITEEFIKIYATIKSETIDFESIKEKVITTFSNNLEDQISFYVSDYINHKLTEQNFKRASKKDEIIKNYNDYFQLNIEEIYEEREKLLTQIIKSNDFNKLILLANNKGLIKIVGQAFGLRGRNEYIDRALMVLKQNTDAQKALKAYFPNKLTLLSSLTNS